jgi:chemotaxis protein MotA
MKARHKIGAKYFADMAGFAPTMGIIGTVMGLLHVLQNLSTPATLGPMIAAAFTATLWGVMQANVFWLPLSNKLKRTSEVEVRRMELLLEGILAIQAGANPRVVEQRLLSYLSPSEQEAAKEAREAAKTKEAA